MPKPTVSVEEYTCREAVAEQAIATKIQAWRNRPAYTDVLKSGTALIGLTGVAAAVGFCIAGPVGAWVAPAVLHLPIIALAGGASDMSTSEHDIYHRHRAAAFKDAGLAGVRDPRLEPPWTDRIAHFLGCRTAEAVITKARQDVAEGVWGAKPSRVTYAVTKDRVEPLLDVIREQRVAAEREVTRIRMSEDGSALGTHQVNGKLQTPRSGGPSAMRVDADGWIGGCVWHDDGSAVRSSSPTPGTSLHLMVYPLALGAECRTMAGELMGIPEHEDLVTKLDLIWERCVTLAAAGAEGIPVDILGNDISIDSLDDWTSRAVQRLDTQEAPVTPRR